MTVCGFFLQGRCRYGDKCWNEHPRDGRGDYRANQPPNRGGFGNRVWVNPSQRSGGEFIQPPSFPRGGSDWDRTGGAPRDAKSFSFNTQNRFTQLNSHSSFDKGGQNPPDDNTAHVDTIQKDMEAWQSSGQWPFSCYSVLNVQISGFVELSPEELRLEYYTSRTTGDLQPYLNSIQQLANKWRSRTQELRNMSSSTQISVISELNNHSSKTSSHGFGSSGSGFGSSGSGFGSSGSGFGSSGSGFGSTGSGFGTGGFGSGSQSSASFSFAPSRTDFEASNPQQAPGFGSAAPAPVQPSSGFGTSTPSAASFSFAAPPAANKPSAGAFGSAAGFSFSASSSSTSAGGFGSGFGSSVPAEGSGVGQSGSGSLFAGGSSDAGVSLFTAQSDLTAEELKEFTAKRFTLGQIPLKPPPADLLMV